MSVAAVSVTTNSTLIIAENFRRVGLVIENLGAATVYMGDVSTVAATTGIRILPFERWMESPSSEAGAFLFAGINATISMLFPHSCS